MQDCASNFPTANPRGRLIAQDRHELCDAVATLRGMSAPGGDGSFASLPPPVEPDSWPENVICISASLENFEREIVTHVSRGDRVIVLAGRRQAARRQAALATGADDFLSTGPVEPSELAARLQWLATGSSLPSSIRLAGTVLTLDGSEHSLTEREAQIVALLIAAKGRFVPHDELLALWGRHAHEAQYMRVAIRSLRRRIEPERDLPRYLLSEPAIGYRLAPGWAPATA